MVTQKLQAKSGFTLIEILVVIGLIAILAAIVLIAINPGRQFAQARNSQRESNVNTILNAIGQNIADNKGIFTCAGIGTSIPSSSDPDDALNIGTDGGLVDLGCLTPTYIASSIPFDPTDGSEEDTEYTIRQDTGSRIVVCAPGHAEPAISGSTEYCLTR
jgi:prepilin-type N-terminal cleavage/methylation domain-containing protein